MLRDFQAFVARILMAAIFLWSGFEKLQNPAGTAQYMIKMGGFPSSPALPLVFVSAAIELICAIMLIVGLRARWAAYILFFWLIPATLMFHVRNHQTVQWMKNLAMMGGFLMIGVYGAGRWSFDGGREKRA